MKSVIRILVIGLATLTSQALAQVPVKSQDGLTLPTKGGGFQHGLLPRSPLSSMSAVPQKISYQGVLTTSSGVPVADGSYTLQIALFVAPTGGAALWTDNFTTNLERGAFSVILGSGAPLNVQFDTTVYVQVTATAGPTGPPYPVTFLPRFELTSAPYSLAPWAPNGDNIYYNKGSVGLGTSNPGNNGIGTLKMELADPDGLNSDLALRVAGQGSGDGFPILNFAKSRGTLASPLAINNLDYMGDILFLGYDGSSYLPATGIGCQSIGTASPGSIAGRILFSTRQLGDPFLFVRMAIDPAGNVGIGTSTPAHTLDVNGTLNATDILKNGTPINLSQWTTSGSNIYYNTGNVGIGTTSPTEKLDVSPNVAVSGLYPYVRFNPSTWTTEGRIQSGIDLAGSHAGDYLMFFVPGGKGFTFAQGGERSLTLDSSGNVGIGNANPSAALDIGTNGSLTGGSVNIGGTYANPGQYNRTIRLEGGSHSAIRAVGGSVQAMLWADVTVGQPKACMGTESHDAFGIFTNGRGGVKMTVDTTGNVGIGTISPSYKLDVNGTVNASDDLNLSVGKAYKINGNKVLSNSGTNNIFAGDSSGYSNTFGHENSFIGHAAGYSITSGYLNSFLGYDAGYSNTNGVYNSFVGAQAGYSNDGNENSFLGYQAGYSNTTGAGNLFLGSLAGYFNTTGDANSFIGRQAGYHNTSGIYNAFIGGEAGFFNTTGHDNSFVGIDAGYSSTTGAGNTMVGRNAGYSNANGNNNTFMGNSAGFSTDTSSDNSFFGLNAGYYNTSGYNNSFFGAGAGFVNTIGSGNTFVGISAAYYNNTSGNNNSILGSYAALGVDGLTNASAIGSGASVGASNTMVFGNTSVIGWGFGVDAASGHAIEVGTNSSNGNGAYLTTGGTWTNASDRNKKENFTSVDGQELLKEIEQLPITMWNYKGESKDIKHIGPMAQDFSRIFKVGNDDKSISTIDPAGIALAAIKELDNQVKELKATKEELEQLKSKLSALIEENAKLKKENDTMNEEQALASARIARIETILQKLVPTPSHPLKVSQNDLK